MSQKKVLEKNYGTRTVLGDEMYSITPSGRKIPMVLCRCSCGVEKYVQRNHLLSGASKNCGCLKAERIAEIGRTINKIHGMDGTHPYKKYCSAKARCTDVNNDSYKYYGGRGIKMMRNTFEEFWNEMGDAYLEHVKKYGKDETTLDRIDVNGNYCKENCRWATRKEQYNNMTTNHGVEYKGKKYKSITSLSEDVGVDNKLIGDRLRRGWSVEDAVDLPKFIKGYEKRELPKRN